MEFEKSDREVMMQAYELSVPCQGLLLRVFHQLRDRSNIGSIVAVTSPHPGAGVSQISAVLAEALRRGGHASAISQTGRELHGGHSGRATEDSLANVLKAIRYQYRFAVIDCGSMKASQSAVRLAPLVDGIILVLEADRTHAEQILYAERTLEAVNGRILGHVLNKRSYFIPTWLHNIMYAVGI